MAARRRTSASRSRRKADEVPLTLYPRNSKGQFVPLSEYRPRDKKGRFLPAKKIPKAVRALIERAKAEREAAARRALEKAARERSERARRAALALVEKRRRARAARAAERDAEQAAERLEEEAREIERAAEAARKVAEEARLAAERQERAATDEERKQKKKEQRKERRAREDEEILRLREEAKAREAAAKVAAKDAEAARIRAKELADAEEVRLGEAETRRQKAMEFYEEEPIPFEPPEPEVVEEDVTPREMTGHIATPEEISELMLREARDIAVRRGDFVIPRTDPTLVRNIKTGSLGKIVRIGQMSNEEGLAEDMGKIAEDIAEMVLGVDGGQVYTAIQLTEFEHQDQGVYVGSGFQEISRFPAGILFTNWQGTTGATSAKAVGRDVLRVMREAIGRTRRVAMVEAIYIRGYARRTVQSPPRMPE